MFFFRAILNETHCSWSTLLLLEFYLQFYSRLYLQPYFLGLVLSFFDLSVSSIANSSRWKFTLAERNGRNGIYNRVKFNTTESSGANCILNKVRRVLQRKLELIVKFAAIKFYLFAGWRNINKSCVHVNHVSRVPWKSTRILESQTKSTLLDIIRASTTMQGCITSMRI